MNQHYRIHEHMSTMRALRHRTHVGGFRGIERRIMISVMLLKLLFPSFWIRHYADIRSHILRNKLIEAYVLLKSFLMIVFLGTGLRDNRIVIGLTIYFIADLVIYLLGLVVLSNLHHSQPNLRRNLILLGLNMMEIISAFAIFYLASGSLRYASSHLPVQTGLEGFYFSIATFATVGYGDMVVMGSIGHFLSILQILTSFLFISLVLSSVVSKLEITSEG